MTKADLGDRSAAAVCSHGLPFAHLQSHSHGTCSSLRHNGYGGKVSRFGVFCDDKVAVVVMIADDDDARGTEARCHASASEMNTGAETFDTNQKK